MYINLIKRTLVTITACLLLGLNICLVYVRDPVDFCFINSNDKIQQKDAFFNYLFPIVKKNVLALKRDHDHALSLYTKYLHHQKITYSEYKFLDQLYKGYVYQLYAGFDLSCERCWKTLLRLTDAIPVSILLAQASIGSNNGTSKAFKSLRNPFNIVCHVPRCGTPIANEPFSSYTSTSIEAFNSIENSIEVYISMLNNQSQYQYFRKFREMSSATKLKNGFQLLRCLSKENKGVAIHNRQKICDTIKKYQLTKYDNK